MQDLRLWH